MQIPLQQGRQWEREMGGKPGRGRETDERTPKVLLSLGASLGTLRHQSLGPTQEKSSDRHILPAGTPDRENLRQDKGLGVLLSTRAFKTKRE